MQLDRSKVRDLVLFFYLVGVLLFIWGNSLMTAEASSAVSGGMQNFLLSAFPWIEKTHVLLFCVRNIRKVMHFSEFFLLAVGAWLWFRHRRAFSVFRLCFMLCLGPCAAFVDEGIQLSTEGRAASIIDVGIDTCGYYTCILLCLTVLFFAGLIQNRRRV